MTEPSGKQRKPGAVGAEMREYRTSDEDQRRGLKPAENGNDYEARARALLDKASGPYAPSTVALQEILMPHPAPITWTRVLITPEMAAAMLERNEPTEKHPWRNRNISKADVDADADELRAGRWRYTHQGIAFDWDGRLQDGQTRLAAIIQTRIGAEMMVSAGMDPDNFPVVDGNRKRTPGQILQAEGVQGATAVAVAIRLVLLYQTWGTAMLDHTRDRVPPEVVRAAWRRIKDDVHSTADLAWAIETVAELRREVRIQAPAPIAALYLIRHALPIERVPIDLDEPLTKPGYLDFAAKLIDGVPASEDRAVHHLRRALIRQTDRQVKRYPIGRLLALVLKGWNTYASGTYAGHELKVLPAESMPRIFLPPPRPPGGAAPAG